MSYTIIDDYLSIEHHQRLHEDLVTTPQRFPWYFAPNVSYDNVSDETFYFVHMFFKNPSYKSSFYDMMIPIIDRLNPKALIRVKANLYPNLRSPTENGVHKDYLFEHLGAVYYVNSNNGYTILEDGTKIESKANRMLFFDASKPHNSTHCTDAKARVTINFNYF